MTVDESLARYGLKPRKDDLDSIRQCLASETEKERRSQGEGDAELMRLCCAQLFGAGETDDVMLIWHAKAASMDADFAIDIQFLCGAGLGKTKAYLEESKTQESARALERLEQSEQAGDFEGFSVEAWSEACLRYYGGS